MKRIISATVLLFLEGGVATAQVPEVRQLADTVVVQAEGQYEADPDLATLTFHVSVQEKELRKAYERATQALNRIVSLAERNALAKADISAGTFTVFPVYDWSDRKRRARAYRVDSRVVLRVRDFSKIGTLIDESVEEGIVDFRSLSYSLEDEEVAKQRAVAEATRRAEARARAALGDHTRKLGALRYLSVDVQQPIGIVRLEETPRAFMEMKAREATGMVAPAPPPVSPEKIRVTARVQCVFQLQ
jgi:hypothetical protein